MASMTVCQKPHDAAHFEFFAGACLHGLTGPDRSHRGFRNGLHTCQGL